jgi:hypothetical protein
VSSVDFQDIPGGVVSCRRREIGEKMCEEHGEGGDRQCVYVPRLFSCSIVRQNNRCPE